MGFTAVDVREVMPVAAVAVPVMSALAHADTIEGLLLLRSRTGATRNQAM